MCLATDTPTHIADAFQKKKTGSGATSRSHFITRQPMAKKKNQDTDDLADIKIDFGDIAIPEVNLAALCFDTDEAGEFEPDKMTKAELVELVKKIGNLPTDLINEDKPLRSADHPTMKPLKLMGRCVKNSTRPGEVVLDSFGGSGSTLMACEQLGRVCFTVELDPHYVDVIIKRWEEYTQDKAQYLGNINETK